MGDTFEIACELLVFTFEDKNDYSFKTFKDLWVESKLREIIEEDLKKPNDDIVENIPYIFYNFESTFYSPEDMYKKAGILYMMYMLYNVRKEYQHFKIMLRYDDYQRIKEFIKYCHDEKLAEPLYIFYKLKLENAFRYFYGNFKKMPNKNVKHMANWKTAKNIHAKSVERITQIDGEYLELLKKIIPDD